jgi:Tfp pilus assembly protein PilN
MAARKKDSRINLLPKDRFSESPLGRVLAWLLSTFRIIVIVVEMVVMLAFFSRFWLDARNSDLDDEIKTKSAQISAFASFEKQYRVLQERLKIFQALASEERVFSENINLITSLLPSDVFVTSFSLTTNEITVAGISPSERSIAQFMVNLENSNKIESVILIQVDTGEKYEGLIGFTLKITPKKGAV